MQNPRHVLITGASSGLGAALAMLYAVPGIRLSLHGRNQERLHIVANDATQRGALVSRFIGDVTDADMMTSWLHECDKAQPIDLIIANAGISPGMKTGQETAEQTHAVFATNLTGVLNTIQPLLPIMQQRRNGQIAIMASLAGFRGFSGAASYCASKAAVRVYGEALRSDLARYNIQVNVICPGFITTPMTRNNPFPMPFIMPPERAASIIRAGLAQNQAQIVFPRIMYSLIRFAGLLPQDRLSALTQYFRKNKAK